jgi:hypothetical protein
LLHRATFAALLIVGLFGATGFSYRTWWNWRLPALYCETMMATTIAPFSFECLFSIGNQKYHRPLQIQEIQLLELAHQPLPGKESRATLQIDTLRQSLQIQPGATQSFVLANAWVLPPLEKQEVRLDFSFHEALAIYQIRVVYQEEEKKTQNSLPVKQYIWLEPTQVELLDFAGLAARAKHPSYETQNHFIYAVARSRHPLALNTLLELLRVQDVRVQNTVCEALAILGDTRAVPALIELVEQSKNPQALRALGELHSAAAVNFLIRTVKDSQEAYLRASAAEALGRIAIPTRGEFKRAIPALVSVITNERGEDAMVQREAMLSLARINDSLAIKVFVDYANRHHSGQILRNFLDVTTIVGDKWLMPILGKWLKDWRYYNLDMHDLELLLDYLVATSHRDMVQILLEALAEEVSAEVQANFVWALAHLSGEHFGEIGYPVFNLATDKTNRQIIRKWQNWWKRAQHDPRFSGQVEIEEQATKI